MGGRWGACALSVWLLLAATSALAQGKTLRLSMMEGVPTVTALPLATLEKAYANLGYTLEVEAMPYARSLLDADRGKFDGELARLTQIEDSALNLRRVPVVLNTVDYVPYILAGTRTDLGSWATLNASGLRIGARRGARLIEDTVRHDRLTLSNSYESLLGMLLLDRIDVVLAPKGQLEAFFDGVHERSKGELHRVRVLPVIASLPVYHYLHRSHEDLIPALTQEILRVQRQSGRPTPSGKPAGTRP